MNDIHDVIIVGGGPTGMMLAAELRLHGVDVVVLERDAAPHPAVRSLGLHIRSIEILDQRGILDRFLAEGTAYPGAGRSLAGLEPAEPVELDTAHDYLLGIPQPITDRLLAERAAELGAVVRRGAEVVGIAQDAVGVDAALADGTHVRGRWLVGADGGRSLVRKALDVGFAGDAATTEWILGEIAVTTSADEIARVAAEVRRTHRGFGIGPVAGGYFRAVAPAPVSGAADERPETPTLEEFRERLRAFAGTDFGAHSPRWMSRFTDATRLADEYRVGRVLLAGDAAHVHPPLGGQGLNLGIQDAFNLGWKLAAVVRGTVDDELLDTYRAERRPVAASVLDLTRAQSTLISPEPGAVAVRGLLGELMGVDGVARLIAERITGIGIRYDLGDASPLVGTRQRDIPLGGGRLYAQLHAGRGMLVDRTGGLSVEGWADRVDAATHPDAAIDAPAVLLRPDGYIAWAGGDQSGLEGALARWFGAREHRA